MRVIKYVKAVTRTSKLKVHMWRVSNLQLRQSKMAIDRSLYHHRYGFFDHTQQQSKSSLVYKNRKNFCDMLDILRIITIPFAMMYESYFLEVEAE